MAKGACMVKGQPVWPGGVHGRGCVAGGMHGQGVCMTGGMHGRGHALQERWPLQWMVHILLECILV